MEKKYRLKDLVLVAATEKYSVYHDMAQNRLDFYDGVDSVSVDINTLASHLIKTSTKPTYLEDIMRKIQRRDD
ncbi:hypothetical protein Goe20_01040 [Bacillus phage vB_BsuM-Goe20]|nr:hypothetical protein BSP14_094 [Bacillus phage BSP14]WCS68967.1 hypothetical protein Goe17_01080 [Bacillus phage vB_BsuM-Goe17]WCS69221.1 hypothetical protein Goe20_01040 [Bacillus phage vB_BsuM-Goe20]